MQGDGVSRDTFYRYQELVEDGGLENLVSKTRKAPNPHNRVDAAAEKAVVDYAIEQPAHGQVGVSNGLRKAGIFVSAGSVRSIWIRNNLENFKKRLSALETKAANDGLIDTEAQVAALEKKKHDDEVSGEIETRHPGYLGSQDTFYVGNLKGVGRIYQQTVVDTCSKVACAKLYTSKTPITAADLLNDQVLPLFSQYELPLLRMLTDRGTEYCGSIEKHDYQLYLAINDIGHTKTKALSPQTNGICERFHRTILNEFYQVTFRIRQWKSYKKIWTNGLLIIIMNAHIKEKCVVAGCQWTHSRMESSKQVNEAINTQMSGHWFGRSQFAFPSRENYRILRKLSPRLKPYNTLRAEFLVIRKKAGQYGRKFAVTKQVPYTDVWDFKVVQPYPGKHPCEKPLAIMEHIITASSNPGDLVLDPFTGSGSTPIAARNLGRKFVGSEMGKKEYKQAISRLSTQQVYS